MSQHQRKLNENLKNLDPAFHYREGIIKYSAKPAEEFEHFLAKCLICWELKNNGLTIITEARFCNGSRADIYVVDWNQAVEIVSSEPSASIIAKKGKYPCPIKIHQADELIRGYGIKITKVE